MTVESLMKWMVENDGTISVRHNASHRDCIEIQASILAGGRSLQASVKTSGIEVSYGHHLLLTDIVDKLIGMVKSSRDVHEKES